MILSPLIIVLEALSRSAVYAAVLHYSETANGFTSQPKGWNSFALTAVGQLEFNQANVIQQCDSMASNLGSQGYKYCSLDSGWSVGANGDEYGRIIYDDTNGWDIPALADHLHDNGMLLGIYIVPGFFHNDVDKFIYGTDPPIQLSTISNGNCDVNARCQFNFSAPGVQEYCNSNVDLFANWGVDFIKLDYVTPGSPDSGQPLDADSSDVVVCYHLAIQQSCRQMRLDISWKLDWQDEYYYDKWSSNADSMRLDQDINNGATGDPQVSFATVQRTIEFYRQYALGLYSLADNGSVSIYPDLDNLLVGNAESTSGLTDDQRRIMYSHWIGAGANLILGSDLTNLDTLGLNMLQSDQWNWLADSLTSEYPMVSLSGTDDTSQGQQVQLWIAGPDDEGRALIVWVNYGQSNLDLYSEPHFKGVVTSTWSSDAIKASGLTAPCYSAVNLWNPSDNGNLKNFSSLQTELDNEKVLVLWLTPNELASECSEAFAET